MVALNWLSLGHCKSPRSHARLGSPISPQKFEMLERIEGLVSHFLAAPDVGRAELGRAGEKLAKKCCAAIQLPSVFFDDVDVGSFLDDIQHTLDPYGQPKRGGNQADFSQQSSFASSATDPGWRAALGQHLF